MSGLERLRGLREERLRRTVALCAKAHPFYRRRFEEEGIGPEGIRTLADLERLPLTQKSDFMDDPASFSLDPALAGDLSFEERTLWNIAYTTGTTSGRPSPFFNTTHDQYHIMMQARANAMLALDEENYRSALRVVRSGIERIETFVAEWEGDVMEDEIPELSFLRDWYEELETERPLSRREQLERDLNVAVDAENFEEAARLRDKLRTMRPFFRSSAERLIPPSG